MTAWPFGDRSEISAEEYKRWLSEQEPIAAGRLVPAPPPAQDWLTKENAFRQRVLARAGELSWRAYFTWNSAHSPAGFPDLVIVRPPRIIAAELKLDGKYPTKVQQVWLDDFAACGIETYCLHPSDWTEIERILA